MLEAMEKWGIIKNNLKVKLRNMITTSFRIEKGLFWKTQKNKCENIEIHIRNESSVPKKFAKINVKQKDYLATQKEIKEI